MLNVRSSQPKQYFFTTCPSTETENSPINSPAGNLSEQEQIEGLMLKVFNDPTLDDIKQKINDIINHLRDSLASGKIGQACHRQSQLEMINFLQIMEDVFCYQQVNVFNLQPGPWNDQDINAITGMLASRIIIPINIFNLTICKWICYFFQSLAMAACISTFTFVLSTVLDFISCLFQDRGKCKDVFIDFLILIVSIMFVCLGAYIADCMEKFKFFLNGYNEQKLIYDLRISMRDFALSKKITLEVIQNNFKFEPHTLYELASKLYIMAIQEGNYLTDEEILPFCRQFSQKIHSDSYRYLPVKEFLNLKDGKKISLKAFLELGENPEEKIMSLFGYNYRDLQPLASNSYYNFFQQENAVQRDNTAINYGAIQV